MSLLAEKRDVSGALHCKMYRLDVHTAAQSSIGMTLQVSVEKRNQISQVTARGLTTIQDLKFDKGILESTQICRSIESEWSNESK